MNKSVLMLALIASSFVLTGCRSMPGRNMFGLRSQPSAEALAGSGPTTTYPAPPSDSANPEAIASVAGGTGPASKGPATPSPETAQVAGVDVSPGYATPASNTQPTKTQPTNMAAAQANGIYGGTGPSDGTDASGPASGYTFGSKALTPKSAASGSEPPAAAVDAGRSSYATNSAYPIPGEQLTAPKTTVASPPESKYATTDASITADDLAIPTASAGTPAVPSEVASPTASAYTMPTDSPAVAAITPPTGSTTATASDPNPAATPFAPPAAITPDFSTASAAESVTAPTAAAISVPTAPGVGGGYMPGSTSTNHGYPTGEMETQGSGSFYR